MSVPLLHSSALPPDVRIVEVGPRDGLQNESGTISATAKIRLIEALAMAGLRTIECGSFVSPKWVPQMADTAEVLTGICRIQGVSYSVLVPNKQGLDAALACGANEIAVVAAASETFSHKNINRSIDDNLARLEEVSSEARAQGLRVRGYVSCAWGCPYEGDVADQAVVRVAAALQAMGCYEISLGDTIGVATPLKAQQVLGVVMEQVPDIRLAVHFHDTWGQALANILASLQMGIAVIDASVAGLGGCPYAPGATGNAATEDVVYMLDGMGLRTGVDLEKLAAAGRTICQELGRKPASRAAAAIAARLARRANTCPTVS